MPFRVFDVRYAVRSSSSTGLRSSARREIRDAEAITMLKPVTGFRTPPVGNLTIGSSKK